MKSTEQSFISDDGKSIHLYNWAPNDEPRACILIAHGMAEHAKRYERFASGLTKAGFAVWAPDHRGHGKTAAEGELGWIADKDGFLRIISDLHGILLKIKTEYPGKPVILFGHSFGSFLSQGFISLYGNEISGCILSGTAGDKGIIEPLGLFMAKLACLFAGQKTPSPFMNKMSFGSFNNPWNPGRTGFEWLSRDEKEVDKYVADPLCGFICTNGFFRDLLSGFIWIHSKDTIAAIPKTLPIYMIAGSMDPVGASTGTFDNLFNNYKALEIKDVSKKLYPEARHEILNEYCKDEVLSDVINWINNKI